MIAGLTPVHGGGRLPAHTPRGQEAERMECQPPRSLPPVSLYIQFGPQPMAGTMHVWLNLPGDAVPTSLGMPVPGNCKSSQIEEEDIPAQAEFEDDGDLGCHSVPPFSKEIAFQRV